MTSVNEVIIRFNVANVINDLSDIPDMREIANAIAQDMVDRWTTPSSTVSYEIIDNRMCAVLGDSNGNEVGKK